MIQDCCCLSFAVFFFCLKCLKRLLRFCWCAWALKCSLIQYQNFSSMISKGRRNITAYVFFLQGWIVKATSSWPKHSVTVDCSSPVLKAFWKPTALQLVLDFIILLLSAWKSVVFISFFLDAKANLIKKWWKVLCGHCLFNMPLFYFHLFQVDFCKTADKDL